MTEEEQLHAQLELAFDNYLTEVPEGSEEAEDMALVAMRVIKRMGLLK